MQTSKGTLCLKHNLVFLAMYLIHIYYAISFPSPQAKTREMAYCRCAGP